MRSASRPAVVADLNDYLGSDGLFPEDARGRLGAELSGVVEAATSHPAGRRVAVAIPCGARHRGWCAGWLRASWSAGDGPLSGAVVTFLCPICGWHGNVTGWAMSPFDMRPHGEKRSRTRFTVLVAPADFAIVRRLDLRSLEHPMPVTAATVVAGGIRIAGTETELSELRGALVAAGASASRRQDRQAFDRVAVAILRKVEEGRSRSRSQRAPTQVDQVTTGWLTEQIVARFPVGGAFGERLASVLERTAADSVLAFKSKARLRSTLVSGADATRKLTALSAYLDEAASLARRDARAALDMLLFAAQATGDSDLREGVEERLRRLLGDTIAAARASVQMKVAMLALIRLFLYDRRFDPLLEFLGDRHAGKRGRRYAREIVESSLTRQAPSVRKAKLLRGLASQERRGPT